MTPLARLHENVERNTRLDQELFVPLHFRGQTCGRVDRDLAWRFEALPNDFVITPGGITLVDHGGDYGETSARLDRAVRALYDADTAGFGRWCPEETPVVPAFGQPPLFDLQRAAVAFFGVLTTGVHLNVHTRVDGVPHLWTARRSRDLAAQPGKLDQAAAGFLRVGDDPWPKLIEEAQEEAGLDRATVERAQAVGSVSFAVHVRPGLQIGAVYIFDLEVEPGQALRNDDGEIEAFELLAPDRALAHVADGDFKFDSGLVVVDFLMRHGQIDPRDPHFLALRAALNRTYG